MISVTLDPEAPDRGSHSANTGDNLMEMMTNKTWDQAIMRRLRAGDRRRRTGGLLTALLGVGLVVGLLPGVAQAHHFERPGPKGVQINVEPDEDLQPVQAVNVSGKGATPNATVTIYQCVNGRFTLAVVPLWCVLIGSAAVSPTGVFTAEVQVSAASAAPQVDQTCASIGTAQCEIVVRDPSSGGDDVMSARHNICFSSPPGTASNACYTDLSGTTTTTTTTAPSPTDEWQPAAPLNVPRRDLATTVGLDGRIYALGGTSAPFHWQFVDEGEALASAEVMDPCGPKTWSPIAPMPTARTQFAAATGPDGRIYAIGGLDAAGGTALATVDAYNPATNTWSSVASLAVPRSDLLAATGSDGRIYAIGGSLGEGALAIKGGAPTQMVEAYDTIDNEWTQVTPSLATHVREEATVGPDGRIYAIGAGNRDIPFPPTASPGVNESYAPGSDGLPGTWRPEPAPAMDLTSRVGNPAAVTGANGLIYAIGGEDDTIGQRSFRSVWAYDTASKTWRLSLETLNTARQRLGAAAGRDGRIYAFGGVDHQAATDDPDPALASTESASVFALSTCPTGLPPADFDGNRTTDYSVFRPSTGTWFVKDGLTVNYGTEGDIPVPGDYDGDRRTDVAVFRPSNGVWFVRQSSGGDTALGYGTAGDIPVPADYDGDTKTDMAVFRPSNGVWFIHYSAGGDAAVAWGTAGDVPVPADYDGDKKADIAVFRSGTWFIRPASGAPDITVNYGTSGDIPVPGDYDADNTADIAVFRPSNGFWFLLHSSDGAQEAFHFGTSGGVPVAGDYNGDAIADPAVFRPSSGVWFVETGVSAAWGTATDIPLPLPAAVRMAYFTS